MPAQLGAGELHQGGGQQRKQQGLAADFGVDRGQLCGHEDGGGGQGLDADAYQPSLGRRQVVAAGGHHAGKLGQAAHHEEAEGLQPGEPAQVVEGQHGAGHHEQHDGHDPVPLGQPGVGEHLAPVAEVEGRAHHEQAEEHRHRQHPRHPDGQQRHGDQDEHLGHRALGLPRGDREGEPGAQQPDPGAAADHPQGMHDGVEPVAGLLCMDDAQHQREDDEGQRAADRGEQQGALGDLALGAVLLGGEQHHRWRRGHRDRRSGSAPSGAQAYGQQCEGEDRHEGQRRLGQRTGQQAPVGVEPAEVEVPPGLEEQQAQRRVSHGFGQGHGFPVEPAQPARPGHSAGQHVADDARQAEAAEQGLAGQ